jgi:NAD(P)-dependent dehydrogenase (short-subunit alcohol dehydrogenase family)
VAIAYLNEHEDAKNTASIIKDRYRKQCLLIPGDLSKENHCKKVAQKVAKEFDRIDVLVNNAALHYENKTLEDLTTKELVKTFSTNIFSFFWLTRESLVYMKKGSCIINTASVTAYRGSGGLIDYASTKGAIVAFTRSLSANLVKKGIRVNGVAPGPIWTPLIASSFSKEKVAQFGSEVPMGRAGEPVEVAPAYLFLASDDASYITGQFIHPNGGEIING